MKIVEDSCGVPSTWYLCLSSTMALKDTISTVNTTQTTRFFLGSPTLSNSRQRLCYSLSNCIQITASSCYMLACSRPICRQCSRSGNLQASCEVLCSCSRRSRYHSVEYLLSDGERLQCMQILRHRLVTHMVALSGLIGKVYNSIQWELGCYIGGRNGVVWR